LKENVAGLRMVNLGTLLGPEGENGSEQERKK
jgi:hypothetical protein